jgi:hypothetical protein
MQERLEKSDISNIVELKNSRPTLLNRKNLKLRVLKKDIMVEGFMSCDSFSDI